MAPLLGLRRVVAAAARRRPSGGLLLRRSCSSVAVSHSWLYSPGKPLLPWPPLRPAAAAPSSHRRPPQLDSAATTTPVPAEEARSGLEKDAAVVSRVLTGPFAESSELEAALHGTGLEPSSPLLEAVLRTSDPSATAVFSLLRWARSRPDFRPSPPLLASIVDLLGKSRSFAAAWSLLLAHSSGDSSGQPFAALLRRYARAGMPQAAIRTFEYARDSSFAGAGAADLFELLMDALCKEGHPRAAEEYMSQRRAAEPGWSPTVRVYNILLHGWLRRRRLRRAEKLWDQLRRQDAPTVVSYGTMIEGLCRLRRVDQAISLLEDMRSAGIPPNEITCNPVVDALAGAGRFREALAAVERFPLYGISPNTSTYNSLVKGFCKNGDLVGASRILKTMIGRGILPTPTTYNYFFRFFAGSGKVEEAMNLYNKIIQSGYSPDRLTYQLLIKMLCEGKRLGLAAQVIGEMKARGVDSDLATSSMMVHLLCRTHQFDEACEEFERMIRKGIVPQYLTYRMLVKELRRLGRTDMAAKLSGLMGSVPHSTKLPNTYREDREQGAEMKKTILRKAQAMSDALKASSDDRRGPADLVGASEKAVEAAKSLISDIKRRVFAV